MLLSIPNGLLYINKSNPIKETKNTKAVKNWTFMLYFCADSRDDYVTSGKNNSANFINDKLNSTLVALQKFDLNYGSEADLNVIVLYDHPYNSTHQDGYAKIYSVTGYEIAILENKGPINMGLRSTLQDFINYCKNNYPANNYALTLSDHGRGYAGFCYDYHGWHPSYDYALGDCLTVKELGQAISNAGGVQVLFLDTCSGGSFEVMWELAGTVKYCVAGESSQNSFALYHPRDILFSLSRDTSMTPLELAQVGFDRAVNPYLLDPDDQNAYYYWHTVSLYDLDKILSFPLLTGGSVNFKGVFEDFTQLLYDELKVNYTLGRMLFSQIRNESTGGFSQKSMMIDLGFFIECVLTHLNDFNEQDQINNYGNDLLNYLFYYGNSIVLDEYHSDFSGYQNFTGFSICFPNTRDMYQEYLYPNFYDDLAISTETDWNEFIFQVFPPEQDYYNFPIPEFYEVNLFPPIDPTVQLHIILDQYYMEEPMHVGYTSVKKTSMSMGVEIGIPGAEFIDTLHLGTCTIRFPTSSLPVPRSETASFTIIINGSNAASVTEEVNVSVKHVQNDKTIWEANQIKSLEVGQVLSCEVSTVEDQWTDFVIEEPSTTTPPTTTSPPSTSENNTVDLSGLIGIKYAGLTTLLGITFTTIIIATIKRKKRNE